MTREEAIAYGKRVIDLGLNDETQAFCELAIKALEEQPSERTETHECDLEHIIKTTIKEYLDKNYDDVTELLLALNKDLCERIRKGE